MYISLGIALVIVVWFIGTFNGLVRLRNHCRESWAGIDTELKRRYELIPNLVETVKSYAAHERDLLSRVTEARARAVASTGSPASQASDENALIGAMKQFFVVAENYPSLKADQNYQSLQAELSNTEDRIAAARRFYNGNVRDYNTRREIFPQRIIARLFGFGPEEFFEIDDSTTRMAPSVTSL